MKPPRVSLEQARRSVDGGDYRVTGCSENDEYWVFALEHKSGEIVFGMPMPWVHKETGHVYWRNPVNMLNVPLRPVVEPDGRESTRALLKKAYPQGLPEEDYLPLLSLLNDDMCDGQLSAAVGECFDRHAAVVSNDLARALSSAKPSPAEIERVRKRLEPAGYDAWIAEGS